MYLVAIAWMYVVLMMAVAEALSTQGTLLGAFLTFGFYGVLPLALVLYILGTPGRRRARRAAEAKEAAEVAETSAAEPSAVPPSAAPDGGSHAARDAVAAEGKEP